MDTLATFPASAWSVLRRYDADHLAKIALPIGGIGTGTISLGGRGDLRDFEIINRPAKGFVPGKTFLALRTETSARLLEGPFDASLYEGSDGAIASNAGLPRFRNARFEATYPFGRVLLDDPTVPLQAVVEAWNPLIPPDTERSGLPVAIFRIYLTNPSDTPVKASVAFSLQNFIGNDGNSKLAKAGRITYRQEEGGTGLFYETDGVAADAETWGTLALATPDTDVTYRTAWSRLSWGNSLLDFWDDFTTDGQLEDRATDGEDCPTGTLCVQRVVEPQTTERITFVLGWHFPNRQSWTPDGKSRWLEKGANVVGQPTIGNYYTNRFSDAWDTVLYTIRDLPTLEKDTLTFVNAFMQSDLPDVVKESALFNLSTLRTQTVFQTADGRFFGWEGCHDHDGSCHGSCTHVWNYEQTTAFLFGSIARSFRDTEFRYMTDSVTGHMVFRVGLPLESYARVWGLAAADGQMGCLMKLYRDWKLCGDDAFLHDLWPFAKKALAFAWIPGGWDADQDGIMEGCQHNTMDVEYYGPNPQMGFWYLGALRAGEAMARSCGDTEFAEKCRQLFETGSKKIDSLLFNGEYYEHRITAPQTPLATGIGGSNDAFKDGAEPTLQLGTGCLVDQLVGQYMAHVCGLGHLANPLKINKTLSSILHYNTRTEFWNHFNPMRTYVYGDESALLMATYPQGNRPQSPFPYFSEVMTGFEQIVAAHLLFEGRETEALTIIRAIRDRYDGRKRNPFNEAECGHHYSRAMAAWSFVLARTGQQYEARTGQITVRPLADNVQKRVDFWATGKEYGLYIQERSAEGDIQTTIHKLSSG